mgnify:CR=1 FL=1
MDKFLITGGTQVKGEVVISGAKLSRDYNTKWYADKVNVRYLNCMNKAKF